MLGSLLASVQPLEIKNVVGLGYLKQRNCRLGNISMCRVNIQKHHN